MSREDELEIERWASAWVEEDELPPEEVGRIRRQVRRHAWAGLGNLLFGVLFLAVYSGWAWSSAGPGLGITSVAVWIFVVGAMLFEIVNRMDTWRPRDRSTRAFLDLSRLQVERRLRGVRFGWLLLAAETLFFIPWIAWILGGESASGPMDYVLSYGFLAAMVITFVLLLRFMGARARAELTRLDALMRELGPESLAA